MASQFIFLERTNDTLKPKRKRRYAFRKRYVLDAFYFEPISDIKVYKKGNIAIVELVERGPPYLISLG